ncbi:hypothetical protein NESM_000091500 [Novymonas esmeraldas]|uniref:Uncharacterized protein n=1 Tax=Novymonas esmeraldas TaxID=1808958 RepID=A0AAW0F406_9TRYP
MGQSSSSCRADAAGSGGIAAVSQQDGSRRTGGGGRRGAEPPAMEMESMLHYAPGTGHEMVTGAAGSANSPTCYVGGAGGAGDVAVFCLDASSHSFGPLMRLMELPPPQRAAALRDASKTASGVLLHARGSTSIHALKQFLLAQASSSSPPDSADALHLFAVYDSRAAAAGAAAGGAAAGDSADVVSKSLLVLPESMELSTLCLNTQLLFLHAAEDGEDGRNPLTAAEGAPVESRSSQPQRRVNVDEEEEEEAAAVTTTSTSMCAASTAAAAAGDGDEGAAGRTLVLLYSRETSFGFDGDDMLLVGCCVAICACIAAGICCCVNAAKNNQNNQNNNGNSSKPSPNYNNGGGGGNGVPNYDYGNNNNNNGGNPQYYNNGNGGAYYGSPQQYNNNYNGGGNSGAPGYGMPPNAYGNNNQNPQYQPQYQPQQQPNYYGQGQYDQQNPQLNGVPMHPATYTPGAPVPAPL